MGNPKGIKRDTHAFSVLEQRRREGAALLRKGMKQAEVARQLKVSATSVSRWARALKQDGLRGLRSAGRAGRKPRLSNPQKARVRRVLMAGPEAHGYDTSLWTLPRITRVIQEVCGVSYHPAHVSKLLSGLGWSCQRPSKKAMERDEEAIRRWKRYTWPALKKKPAANAEPSYS